VGSGIALLGTLTALAARFVPGAFAAACGTNDDCADANPCTDDVCDPVLGCLHPNNTAPCDDGNPCTTADTCRDGACVAGPPLDCDDANPCTDDLCDPRTGCRHGDNSAPCNDGNACTTADVCHGGTCVGGDPAAGCAACDAAAALPAQGGTFVGHTAGSGTLAGSCADSGGSGARVYRWTPATSGLATLATCGQDTSYDTVLSLRGAACTGPEVACNDDTPGCDTGEPNDHHGSRLRVAVTGGATYWIVVTGYGGHTGTYRLTVDPPATCGNGVREPGEQCDGADAAGCLTAQCTSACTCVTPAGGLPDLVPVITDVALQRGTTAAPGDVAEGCAEATSGVDLLRFSVASLNIGTADLHLGDPGCPSPCSSFPLVACSDPQFICSPAAGHNHAHYTNYARYELLDAQAQAIVVGHKQGFCLRDSDCPAPRYTCTDQGVSAGCSDLYASTLGCQYLDVTGVPPGRYTLRVTMDPFDRIAELDEANNVATEPVTLAPDPCAAPAVIPAEGGTVQGVTAGPGALVGSCAAATAGAPEAVFQWTPATSGVASLTTCGAGTGFDTVVYVRSDSCAGPEIACNDDTPACDTGDGCERADHHGSVVHVDVAAGETYWIVVDGYAGSCGGASGPFSLTVTPP